MSGLHVSGPADPDESSSKVWLEIVSLDRKSTFFPESSRERAVDKPLDQNADRTGEDLMGTTVLSLIQKVTPPGFGNTVERYTFDYLPFV